MNEQVKECDTKHNRIATNSSSGAVYGLGVIGAAFFYIQHASTFWIGCLGVLKALFWPALLVYKLIEILKF